MDQYLSTVIIALITGIFSILTIIIQKKQDQVITKIDKQTTFIDREKSLKKTLDKKEKERAIIMQDMMITVMDIGICLLSDYYKNNPNAPTQEDLNKLNELLQTSDELKSRFNELNDEIEDISHEYSILLDITNEFQQTINALNKNHSK